MKIYHNPRCKKSRAGLEYLEEKKISFTKIMYLKDEPFTDETLKSLLKKMNKTPLEIIRTQEKEYKDNFKGKIFTDDEWIKIMVKNPKFIQRPIIETENKAVLGDPPSNIEEIL
ncbi:MAG: arsenate reductase family protein [Bacteroidales bacterium]|nr:arsenate reductase family protein [Bacteroidales bacterium]